MGREENGGKGEGWEEKGGKGEGWGKWVCIGP
jgi:hypothetical protein